MLPALRLKEFKVKTLLAIIGVLFGISPDCNGAICRGKLTFEAEIPTIRKAAERNDVKFGSDDWFILLAIRKAENGRDGLQFGVMNPKAYNLDTQAGWASATIIKNRARWIERGRPCYDFIEFLSNRYCPPEDDPEGNVNWKRNVRFWSEKLKQGDNAG